MKAAAAEAGIDGLAGRRVVVQGIGAVGMGVLELAIADDAELVASDINADVCDRAQQLGASIVCPGAVHRVESDIFSPCAMRGVITTDVARALRTSAVAGAANNVYADRSVAVELASRDVVLAPDFVAGAGGAIHRVGREVLGWSAEGVATHVDAIEQILRDVFARAAEAGLTQTARPNRWPEADSDSPEVAEMRREHRLS